MTTNHSEFFKASNPGYSSTTTITSRNNPLIRQLHSLSDARGIHKHGFYLAGGPRLITEALRSHADHIEAIIKTADMPDSELETGFQRYQLSVNLFKSVNFFGTPGPLLLMRLPSLPLFDFACPWPKGCTVFVPFGDPENVGGVIRAAAALTAVRVVLTSEAADPFLPRSLRASAGTVWKIPLYQTVSLSKLNFASNYPVFTLDAGGQPLETLSPPAGAYGLLAGREGSGLADSQYKGINSVAIPMSRGVESLNAATSVAIVLWAWR